MQIYHYDPTTFEYLTIGFADESPLEPGVFLIPANATKTEPPEFQSETHSCRFINNSWQVAEIPQPEPEPLPEPVPDPRIAELKSELAALDIKRIRPTAEGDTAYLITLNAQAVALRAELQALL